MSLSAVFKYMAKQAVDSRNMVRVKVWHTHTTVWLVKNYSQRILTYNIHRLVRIYMYSDGSRIWKENVRLAGLVEAKQNGYRENPDGD